MYDSIVNALLFDLGLEETVLGTILADVCASILTIVFGFLPIVVSIFILVSCIKGVRR